MRQILGWTAARARRRASASALVVAAAAMVAACSGIGIPPSPGQEPLVRLYTSVTQDTVDAVVDVFNAEHAGTEVEVFRAPTGELTARIAAEQREGRIRADVLWLTDPLSMQEYDSQALLRTWTPEAAEGIDAAYRSDTFWGTRILNMVIVTGSEVDPPPADWADLADPAYQDAVAIPDPGFAGSAFGALGYFALEDAYGFDYLRDLEANGTVQVQAPDEVTTGVAEGRYQAGMTLDFSVRQAIENGSPVEMVWPASGAIAMYSPIAVLTDSDNPAAAEAFVETVLSTDGQEAIADTGWQPVREDVAGPPVEGSQVTPDWPAAFDRQEELLEEYRSIFGG
ncbi:MAG: extracellular solute-binding protein [Chloroflexi bacterium]|nr:extracellular solute-binding protein [Chloroflexota bacterium]